MPLTSSFQFEYFNPRSREGSDAGAYVPVQPEMLISIHAPAKGATRLSAGSFSYLHISIHAPAKGATAKITKTIPNDFCKINNYNNGFA